MSYLKAPPNETEEEQERRMLGFWSDLYEFAVSPSEKIEDFIQDKVDEGETDGTKKKAEESK